MIEWLSNSTDANWMLIGASGTGAVMSAVAGVWVSTLAFAVTLAVQILILKIRKGGDDA